MNRKHLLKNRRIYQSFGIKRSVLKSIDSRVLKQQIGDIRNFEPPKSFQDSINKSVSEDFKNDWEENGFIILKNFLSADEVNTINSEIKSALEKGKIHFNYTQRKIFNAHKQIKPIENFAKNKRLLEILKGLIGKPPIHFQTINFNKGSEQQAHSDSIHMTTLPLGFLVGVWVALEEINSDNGPLVYYPASHKLPYILNDDYGNTSNAFLLDGNANKKYEQHAAKVLESSKLERVELKAQPGDVLIWHANLMHGGAAIKNENLTRKSMVMHFYAEDVLCFHEISERPAILK